MSASDFIRFQCRSCGKGLRANSGAAGKQLRCPKCRKLVDVPLPLDGDGENPITCPQPEPLSLDDELEASATGAQHSPGAAGRRRSRDRGALSESGGVSPGSRLFWIAIVLLPVMLIASALTAYGTFSTVRANYARGEFSERRALGGRDLAFGFLPGTKFTNVRVETSLLPLIVCSFLAIVSSASWIILRQRHARKQFVELPWWPATLAVLLLVATPVTAALLSPMSPPKSFPIHKVIPTDREVWGDTQHPLGLILSFPIMALLVWGLYNWRSYLHRTETIRFKCPRCEKLLRAASKVSGTRIICPQCENLVVVPFSCDEEPPPIALKDADDESTAQSGQKGKSSGFLSRHRRAIKIGGILAVVFVALVAISLPFLFRAWLVGADAYAVTAGNPLTFQVLYDVRDPRNGQFYWLIWTVPTAFAILPSDPRLELSNGEIVKPSRPRVISGMQLVPDRTEVYDVQAGKRYVIMAFEVPRGAEPIRFLFGKSRGVIRVNSERELPSAVQKQIQKFTVR